MMNTHKSKSKLSKFVLCLGVASALFLVQACNWKTGGSSMSTNGKLMAPVTAPLPEGLVEANSKVSSAAVIAFTEGPAADAEGSVYFSDIINNRIMKLAADGKLSVFRADSGRTNGNMFDSEGRLVSCEGSEMGQGGRRRIVRTDMKTGKITVLTERYEGKRYNSPNDLAIDSQGRIYFTDPCYGDRSIMEMDIEGVYRIDTSGRVSRVLEQPAIQRPNGIAITPDDKRLYLVDSNPSPGSNRKIWAFDIQPDGKLTNQKMIYDFAPGRGGDRPRPSGARDAAGPTASGPRKRELRRRRPAPAGPSCRPPPLRPSPGRSSPRPRGPRPSPAARSSEGPRNAR